MSFSRSLSFSLLNLQHLPSAIMQKESEFFVNKDFLFTRFCGKILV